MLQEVTYNLLPRNQTKSDYDWLNIDHNEMRLGKVRGLIECKTLTIYSINIFPEFERHGYATRTIEMFKKSFDWIIADRVRYSAIGFWLKMGFHADGNGNYIYQRK